MKSLEKNLAPNNKSVVVVISILERKREWENAGYIHI